ncbi:SDR family NAD(P)-dependent oxidoreductase [Sphingomonas adhaesiva]|uniref:3-hydroxyacyl-CoA dehydrogenase n=1 Tax=Sphingomonas adhaesiva TaxID=28212 RepID=A0A2A4I292_9SPHN|nr:SDR family oxidoreductase [Sphingomonas adhaesiva]PCG13107.1 3-hydroxyacyl-CoA dehydrogenase [Sphingomonas adhaesiva]
MRHALVTGGGSGIGLAIARRLADEGCAVTIAGRTLARLAEAARLDSRLNAVVCDVCDQASVDAAFGAAAEARGPVAILVNNAGIVRTAPFARQTDTDWNEAWKTNVLGAVHAIRAVIAPMRAMPEARIVNVASTAGQKGYAYTAAYSASKHALLGLTRVLATELARTGVTVNAVCPGYTATGIVDDAVANIVARTGRTADEALTGLTGANPQGRLVDPLEVADAVAWLVGDLARSVTGQTISIAGGEVA